MVHEFVLSWTSDGPRNPFFSMKNVEFVFFAPRQRIFHTNSFLLTVASTIGIAALYKDNSGGENYSLEC